MCVMTVQVARSEQRERGPTPAAIRLNQTALSCIKELTAGFIKVINVGKEASVLSAAPHLRSLRFYVCTAVVKACTHHYSSLSLIELIAVAHEHRLFFFF